MRNTQGFPPDPLFALASSFLTVVAFAAGNALLLSGFVAFGTGEGLLRYGIRIRCSKRLPTVRDAFSEALGAQNRLLRYGRDIRYRKPPSLVRNEATGCCHCVASSDPRMRPNAGPGSKMRLL